MITSNLDIAIGIILIVFSTCGLVRGFLKEISSVVNWFGSFYLTSIIKPFVRPFFEDKIQIPFLLDTVMNVVVFVVLIIVISVITNYISITLKKIIPASINGSIGMLCGFLRGFLISAIIIAFVKIVYDKANNKPEWIENSHIYNSISYDGNIFVNMLNNIFGDYKKEEKKEDGKDKEYLNNRFRQSNEKKKREFDRVFDIINENYEDEFDNKDNKILIENVKDNTKETTNSVVQDIKGIVMGVNKDSFGNNLGAGGVDVVDNMDNDGIDKAEGNILLDEENKSNVVNDESMDKKVLNNIVNNSDGGGGNNVGGDELDRLIEVVVE